MIQWTRGNNPLAHGRFTRDDKQGQPRGPLWLPW